MPIGKPLLSLLHEVRETGRLAPLVSTADVVYDELSDRSLVRKLNQAQADIAQRILRAMSTLTFDRHTLSNWKRVAVSIDANGIARLPSDMGALLCVRSEVSGPQLRRIPAGATRRGDYSPRGLREMYFQNLRSTTAYVEYVSNLYAHLIGGTVASSGSTTTSLVASTALRYDMPWTVEDEYYTGLGISIYAAASPSALTLPTYQTRISAYDASTRTFTLEDTLGGVPTAGAFWCTCGHLPPIAEELLIYSTLLRIPQARQVIETFAPRIGELERELTFQIAMSNGYQ